jgi:hypothetical protein
MIYRVIWIFYFVYSYLVTAGDLLSSLIISLIKFLSLSFDYSFAYVWYEFICLYFSSLSYP